MVVGQGEGDRGRGGRVHTSGLCTGSGAGEGEVVEGRGQVGLPEEPNRTLLER